MGSDRVNELYYRRIFDKGDQETCRQRIHWMVGQAKGKRVLDIGCSQGIASILLGRAGHEVVGVDVDPKAVEYASAELEKEPEPVRNSVTFQRIEPGPLPFDDASFDTVLFGEVIEHLAHPEQVLRDLRRVLTDDGRIVLTTPYGLHPHPDHLQTFYLTNFLELVGKAFSTCHLSVYHKYICYVGSASPEDHEPAIHEPAHLLDVSQHGFLWAERRYNRRLEGLRAERAELRKKLRALEALDVASVLPGETTSEHGPFPQAVRQWVTATCLSVRRVAEMIQNDGTEVDLSLVQRRLQRLADRIEGGITPGESIDLWPDLFQDVLDIAGSQLAARLHEVQAEAKATRTRLETELKRERAQHQRQVKELEQRHKQAITELERARDELVARMRSEHESRQAEAVAAVRSQLQPQIDTLQQRLRKSENSSQVHERARRLLETRLNRHAELLAYFRASLELREQEVRYRLGDLLVSTASQPWRLPLLPYHVAKLFLEGLKRRRERKALEQTPEFRAPSGSKNESAALSDTSKTAASSTSTSGQDAAPAQGESSSLFKPIVRPERPPRLPITAAVILDEFSYDCFRGECRYVEITPDDWRAKLSADRPDFLFVESAWRGNHGAWQSQLTRAQYMDKSPLLELLDWCKEQNIKTVFWNKEDPPNFEHFIYVAARFDYIFTTDENCVPRYKEVVGHDRVWALPFAAQTDIHNPIGSNHERLGNLAFAGTYYAMRHADRRADIDLLLKPALSRGLTIFDRMANYTKSDYYKFPPEYKDVIYGSLSYPEMVDAYKKYRVFLNVNSVKDSPTMFSRRVFELLACGTPVISTYSLGVEKMLGADCVPLVETEEQAAEWMDKLLADEDLRDRMTLLGRRRILSEHTYVHRFRFILDKIGIPTEQAPQRVSVVTCSNRPTWIENVIANYQRQRWPDKELVLVLNHDGFDLDEVKRRLETVPNARAYQLPEERSLGECLNHGIDQSRYEYWTKFDDDNFHAENFLTDLMLAFTYADADLIGKCSYFAYLEGLRCLALRFPDYEHRYVDLLSGSAMIVKRGVFEKVRFPERSVGEDTQFIRDCREEGFRMFSTDRFNYVVRRAKSQDEHTWKVEDQEYLKKCRIVDHTDDYKPYVVV